MSLAKSPGVAAEEPPRRIFPSVFDFGALRWWALGAMLLFAAMVVPPILVDAEMHRPIYSAGPGSLSLDMLEHHLPQINFFIVHPWNVVSYPGLVTSLPGHHIWLAWAARLLGHTAVSSKTLSIRILHALFCWAGSMLFFFFLHRMQSRQGRPVRIWTTTALCLSVAASFYFVQSSIYISTDTPALGLYLVFLYFTIFYPKAIATPTIIAASLVFWRQSYATVLAAPLLAVPNQIPARLLNPIVLSLIIPGAILLFYIIAFGGLVPANAGLALGGVFPHSILHAFAYLGLVLPIYLFIFVDTLKATYRSTIAIPTMVALSVLVTVLWISTASTYSYDEGRWGSIVWTLRQYGPQWGSHSLLILFLGLLGAAFAVMLAGLAVDHVEVRIVLLGMFLYLSPQILMPLALQRYIEPIILVSLALIAARCVAITPWRLVIFASAFGVYGLIGLMRIYDAIPVAWIAP
jgi:hypothetical protein